MVDNMMHIRNYKTRLAHITHFGDTVFAFPITFMALSIQIPDLPHNLSETQVADKLVQLLPRFEIYLIIKVSQVICGYIILTCRGSLQLTHYV
jgi:hypothetical protein